MDEAVAAVAVHLGVVEEEKINEMSIPFFDDILTALGKKLSYDAVVNYAGNSFCEKSGEMISDANPLRSGDGAKNSTMRALAGFFEQNASVIQNDGEVKLPGKGFNGRDKRGKD